MAGKGFVNITFGAQISILWEEMGGWWRTSRDHAMTIAVIITCLQEMRLIPVCHKALDVWRPPCYKPCMILPVAPWLGVCFQVICRLSREDPVSVDLVGEMLD